MRSSRMESRADVQLFRNCWGCWAERRGLTLVREVGDFLLIQPIHLFIAVDSINCPMSRWIELVKDYHISKNLCGRPEVPPINGIIIDDASNLAIVTDARFSSRKFTPTAVEKPTCWHRRATTWLLLAPATRADMTRQLSVQCHRPPKSIIFPLPLLNWARGR